MIETPFTETELLLAVMNRDGERAAELLSGMTISELQTLEGQVGVLGCIIGRALNDDHPEGYNRGTLPEWDTRRSRFPKWADAAVRTARDTDAGSS